MSNPLDDMGRRQRISAAAVARRVGVSPATVSYVMNGRPGVSEETKQQVLAVAEELGYVHRPKRQRGVNPSRVVGLIVPNILNPMYPRWAQGVITAAAEAGYEVFLGTSQDDTQALVDGVSALVARQVDGVVLVAAVRDDATALRLLRTARIPYVQLSRKSDFVAGDFVGIDDSGAAETLMNHVIGHGHSAIATVVGPRLSSASSAREAGFLAAAERAGVRVPPEWRISTAINNVGGRLAAEQLLASGRPPRAILCGSDELAIGVMEQVRKRGLRTPDDIAIAGIDGLPHSMSALINLTTVIQPQDDMAKKAFELLEHRMAGQGSNYETVIFPHELHIGATCGCQPD